MGSLHVGLTLFLLNTFEMNWNAFLAEWAQIPRVTLLKIPTKVEVVVAAKGWGLERDIQQAQIGVMFRYPQMFDFVNVCVEICGEMDILCTFSEVFYNLGRNLGSLNPDASRLV